MKHFIFGAAALACATAATAQNWDMPTPYGVGISQFCAVAAVAQASAAAPKIKCFMRSLPVVSVCAVYFRIHYIDNLSALYP